MKEIKAIIKPFMLEGVIRSLHQISGLPAVTISSAHGLSVERGAFDQVAMTKLEVIVPDEQAETLVQAIQKAAHTGNPGGGRIFVIPVAEAVKIRTGERGAWR